MMQLRYDEEKGIYRDCRFCGGKGCIACPGEAERAYKREFPHGPEPVLTFHTGNPEEMQVARETIGLDALRRAFEPGGGGIEEIIQNVESLTHQIESEQ